MPVKQLERTVATYSTEARRAVKRLGGSGLDLEVHIENEWFGAEFVNINTTSTVILHTRVLVLLQPRISYQLNPYLLLV